MTTRLDRNPSRPVRYLLILFAFSFGAGCTDIALLLVKRVVLPAVVTALPRPPPPEVATSPSVSSAGPPPVAQNSVSVTQSDWLVARSEASGQMVEAELGPGLFEVRLPALDADDVVYACASTDPASRVNGRTGALINTLECFVPWNYTFQEDGPLQSMFVGVGNNHLQFNSDDRTDFGVSTWLQFRGFEYVDGAAGPFYLTVILARNGADVLGRENYHFHVEPVPFDAASATPEAQPSAAVQDGSAVAPRFVTQPCGSIVDTATRTEWLAGPDRTMDERERDDWVYAVETCGRGWNLPTVAEAASLAAPSGAPGQTEGRLPAAFAGIGRRQLVWTDSSEYIMRGDQYVSHNLVAYDLGTGEPVVVRVPGSMQVRTVVSRPYFTEADWRATPPAFSDFPATARYQGRTATVQFAEEGERMFRTRLREIAAGPTNFAGEYGFGCWGMGGGNLGCAAVNKRTGQVVIFGSVYHSPHPDGNNRDFEPTEVRASSRLLLARGMLGTRHPVADHYYELRDGDFHLVRLIPRRNRSWE